MSRGSISKVFLAELRQTKKLYAIKVIKKNLVLTGDYLQSMISEKDVLFGVDHPFLISAEFLFQSDTNLYFVTPFVNGGELYMIFLS